MAYLDVIREGKDTLLVLAVAVFTLVALLSMRLSGLMVDNAAQLRAQDLCSSFPTIWNINRCATRSPVWATG